MKELITNIRTTGEDDLGELRESMQTFGWVPAAPAIQDEHGVLLVGYRRMAVAAELGIAPVIETITFGDGDEADAKRLRLALVSNLDRKPFTVKDREHIAEVLYWEQSPWEKHEFSMPRIAEMLKQVQQMEADGLAIAESEEPLEMRNAASITISHATGSSQAILDRLARAHRSQPDEEARAVRLQREAFLKLCMEACEEMKADPHATPSDLEAVHGYVQQAQKALQSKEERLREMNRERVRRFRAK